VTLTIGAGDLALSFAGVTLGGIGTATFGAILLYQLFRESGATIADAPPGDEPQAKT
jgi:putative pyrimidine permease RutG